MDTIFGIPGLHTLGLYDAMAGAPSIRHILTRHEQGAAFAADGVKHLSVRMRRGARHPTSAGTRAFRLRPVSEESRVIITRIPGRTRRVATNAITIITAVRKP